MDEITKTGIQYVATDIKEQYNNSRFLMNSAINFIKKLQNIVASYDHLDKMMELKENGGNNLSQIKVVMNQTQEGLKQIISAQYTFEEQINNFLGRKIHLAWVDIKTGEVFLAEETSAKEIYNLVSRGKGFSGSVNMKKDEVDKFKKKISSLPSFVQKKYKDLVDQRISNHQSLIKEVMERITANSSKNSVWYEEHANTVYWQHPPKGADNFNHKKWAWSIPTKPGFISQGYIDLIFNHTITLKNNEHDIGYFMMNFIHKDEKIPGVVQGDIIVKNTNDEVQIAVKSNTLFSTASVGPYITTAYQIIEFYDALDDLNVENVQKILKGLEKYPVNILRASQDRAKEILEKIFTQSGATLN